MTNIQRKPTRAVRIGDSCVIGQGHPIVVQSMCATPTTDIKATIDQCNQLHEAGAGVVRVAVDSKKDAEALKTIRQHTAATLSVDLQENYRIAAAVAPMVDKLRYNPGHLHHHEKKKTWQDKVRYLVDLCGEHDCAMRVGVNSGSVDPVLEEKLSESGKAAIMVASATEHAEYLDSIGFTRYCVSLKSSNPTIAVDAYKAFAEARPEVPLHLGVTEAGMPPDGIIKTRIAFEQLIGQGIGDTIRVSLTLPFAEKWREIEVGQQIIDDIHAGRVRSVVVFDPNHLNIISCPSCSRVENEAFIELAHEVKAMTEYAKDHAITIAVMGCRVNGPGETDDADLGLWCGPNFVNMKRGEQKIGAFPYDDVLPELKRQLDTLIEEQKRKSA
ncbi:(E)-4-hydroxy-3-methylbut-2-enyl-diphosphate synthase [Gammaproteobacteria bacterium]|nr:(E)-4-hydroxy-3-methylbut-2-enyl-diphosphate synthase [Gammaproteobacteria bacterium]